MLAPGIGFAIAAISVSFVALPVLYPLFQAVKLRWWISGLRFGDVAVTSRLRIRQVYWVYLRVILYFLLFGLLTAVVGGVLFPDVLLLLPPQAASVAAERAPARSTRIQRDTGLVCIPSPPS